MFDQDRERIRKELDEIKSQGLWKEERVIASPQGAMIRSNGKEVLCLCANNYLGLANDADLRAAAKKAVDSHGLGLASVRFICGTQDIHKTLEQKVSRFLGTEDTILYSSCFDANGGLFETLTGEQDAIISDALNHASIIDGIRLSKAQRFRYQNGDMTELEQHLQATQSCRSRLIATDGVFSMDGYVAKLPEICTLADKYKAMVMVDDSHATGFFGPTGRGTPEFHRVAPRIDILTSTLGKALGGAAGGFTTGRKEIVDLLRNRSRPYLFSNTLAPAIAGATIACLDKLSATTALRDKLAKNTQFFRAAMAKAGFAIVPGEHPICPIMLGEATVAVEMAHRLLDEGVYVIGFSYPVVPKGKARIRVQISAAHEIPQLEAAVASFAKVGRAMGIVGWGRVWMSANALILGLGNLCVAAATIGCVFALIAAALALRFGARREHSQIAPHEQPSVTILKPLCGQELLRQFGTDRVCAGPGPTPRLLAPPLPVPSKWIKRLAHGPFLCLFAAMSASSGAVSALLPGSRSTSGPTFWWTRRSRSHHLCCRPPLNRSGC